MTISTMTNFLELSVVHYESEGSLELKILFSCDGFSGQSTAYFDARSLASKAARLREFPLPSGQIVTIEGGYFDNGQSGALKEKHVSLTFAQGHSQDVAPIELRVGAGVPWHHKRGLQHWAEATFGIDYEQLKVTAKAIEALATGKKSVARIELNAFG
jgi:hypothetical protein